MVSDPSGGALARATFGVRLLVTVGFLLLVVAFVDWRQLIARLAGVDPTYLTLVLLLATGDRLLMAWKWWLLIRGRAAAVSLEAAVRAYYLASFAGYFLPMTLGADAVRIGALAGRGRTAGLVASVVLERTIGALAQAVLALISLATLLALGRGARLGSAERWLLAALVALSFAVFPFSFHAAEWAAGRLGTESRWRRALADLATSYARYRNAAGLVSLFFALTLVEGAFPITIHYAAGRTLGLDLGWTFYIATVPLVFLLARLPVSLGGLGFLELSFVSLAGFLGVVWTDAFAIAGLATALYLVALLPGAILYLYRARRR